MKNFQIPRLFSTIILWCMDNHNDNWQDIGLPDKDLTNFKYRSQRSKMCYLYLRTPLSMVMNYICILYLRYKTGIWFTNKINLRCLPLNIYENYNSIRMHRDRDMFDGSTPTYVLVITLLQTNDYSSEFTLITNPIVYNNGKTVLENPDSSLHNKESILTCQNTVLWFDNTNTAHKLDVERGRRISLTYRTNY